MAESYLDPFLRKVVPLGVLVHVPRFQRGEEERVAQPRETAPDQQNSVIWEGRCQARERVRRTERNNGCLPTDVVGYDIFSRKDEGASHHPAHINNSNLGFHEAMVVVEAVEIRALEPVTQNDNRIERDVATEEAYEGWVCGALVFHDTKLEVGSNAEDG